MPNDDLVRRVLERLGPHPFVDALGCELIDATEGSARVRLPWRDDHGRSGVATGEASSLHGGAAAALADIAASCALLTVLRDGEGRTTIDLAIHYLAPLRGDVIAEAAVRRRGGRTAIIDIEISDRINTLGAIARATYAILPPRG